MFLIRRYNLEIDLFCLCFYDFCLNVTINFTFWGKFVNMAYARMLNIRISELRSKEINENCHKNISIKELEDLFTEPQRTRMPTVLPKSEVSKTEKSVTLPRPNKPR